MPLLAALAASGAACITDGPQERAASTLAREYPLDEYLKVCPQPPNAGPAEPRALSKEVILGTINHHIGGSQRCYESYLARTGDWMERRLLLGFSVEADGTVGHAAIVRSNSDDTRLNACILESFAAMRFPPPDRQERVCIVFPVVLATSTSLEPIFK